MSSAEEMLSQIKRYAASQMRACRIAARNENLVLIDKAELAALESLRDAVAEALSEEHCHMTRDYKDVQAQTGQTYNGKRFLIDRHECEAVFRKLRDVKPRHNSPTGCLAGDA